MANFLENIFAQLLRAQNLVVLREVRGDTFVSVTGDELLQQVQHVRAYLRNAGLQPGDRCALLAANSIRWAAVDLALMAEGVIVVPLYVRQSTEELAAMMRDCQPRLLLTGDVALGEAVAQEWRRSSNAGDVSPRVQLDDVLRLPPDAEKEIAAPVPNSPARTGCAQAGGWSIAKSSRSRPLPAPTASSTRRPIVRFSRSAA